MTPPPEARLLAGAIDFHVHAGPDTVPRSGTAVDIALAARERGMAGIVLKGHHVPTTPLAALASELVPGIRVIGGVVLNDAVGGLNPAAVEAAIGGGGRVVWMPSISAANHRNHPVRDLPQVRALDAATRPRAARPRSAAGITVLDRDGGLAGPVFEILELIRDAGMVLETSHLGAGEIRVLVGKALAMKVDRIVITHPEHPAIGIPVDEQADFARRGVILERCYVMTTGYGISMGSIANAIRSSGASQNILGSDCGGVHNPPPGEAMQAFVKGLLESGISEEEIEAMARTVPAALLSL